MHKVVKEAFFLIIMVTAAMLMYYVLFGSWNDDGELVDGTFNYGKGEAQVTSGGQQWEGVLWYSARVIENPIAFYYYNYCLVPNVHKTDYLDMELGCKVYGKNNMADIKATDYTNQSKSVRATNDDYITYPTLNYSTHTEMPTSIQDFNSKQYYYKPAVGLYNDF